MENLLEKGSISYQKLVNKKRDALDFDEILEASGGFGKFQFLILVALLLPEIPAAMVTFSPVFVGKSSSSWTCDLGDENGTKLISREEMCNCRGVLMAQDVSSIVSEWNLVCDSSWVSDFITSVQMLGMLVGSLFSSQISDWYGRKWVYLGVCFLMGFGQMLSVIAPSPIVYAVARFFAGAGISGFMGMSTIYPLEFMTPNWRLLIASVGPWGVGIILLALWAYFVQNQWRALLLYSSFPFLFVFIVVPFIPESPRWLIRNGRVKEAVRVVRTIQMINGRREFHVTHEMLERIAKEESGGCGTKGIQRFSYLDFFRDEELRKKTLLLMGIWFSWSLVYFGISYNVKNLKGDPYLNVAFMGLSDALGYPTALLINNKLGRRKSLVIFMFLGALFLVALAALEVAYGAAISAGLVTFLCLSGKVGVAGARSAIRMLTGESFPTAIRTMGYGISGVTAGVGGVIAPQIAYFGSLWWSPLPFVTFGVISVAGSLLSLFLPETAGKGLQEQMGLISNNSQKTEKNYKAIDCDKTPLINDDDF